MIVLYAGDDAHIERWTTKRGVALVVSLLKGETSVAEAARTHGLTVANVEDWREKFLPGPRTPCGVGPRRQRARWKRPNLHGSARCARWVRLSSAATMG